MADSNKVKFGLKNVHYAVATVSGSTVTYGTPKAIAGAVNLSLDAQGGETNFYADDSKYYVTNANQGYSGDLEVAKFPESFYEDIFGFATDDNGIIYEDAAIEPKQFALLFEFSGDANETRHALYLCNASRPAVASGTIQDTKEPVTESTTITAVPLPVDSNGKMIVRGKANKGDSKYSAWFTAVQTVTVASTTL